MPSFSRSFGPAFAGAFNPSYNNAADAYWRHKAFEIQNAMEEEENRKRDGYRDMLYSQKQAEQVALAARYAADEKKKADEEAQIMAAVDQLAGGDENTRKMLLGRIRLGDKSVLTPPKAAVPFKPKPSDYADASDMALGEAKRLQAKKDALTNELEGYGVANKSDPGGAIARRVAEGKIEEQRIQKEIDALNNSASEFRRMHRDALIGDVRPQVNSPAPPRGPTTQAGGGRIITTQDGKRWRQVGPDLWESVP